MTPQEVLAILQALARQQLRVGELEAEVARLQEMVEAAVKGPSDGVPG